MDKISEITQATIAALMRDYYLWMSILMIILAFALYLYFFPNAIDFFDNPKSSWGDDRLRSEPPTSN